MSWKKDFANSIRSQKELESFLDYKVSSTNYPIFIPKSFAQRIKESGVNSPLWNQFIPNKQETNSTQGLADPIGDQQHQKDGGIIHRYKSRILYNPTVKCPINCRYCFRKNELFENLDTFRPSLEKLQAYLGNNKEVEEVILTGGDPLILSDSKIEKILNILSTHKHVKYVRFHSRTPVILPSRMDENLSQVLKKYTDSFETITLVIHTNHSIELSDDLKKNLENFKFLNILSQSVLLKGVNDSLNQLINLFKALNKMNIKPYYLHHPDQVLGAMHFYIPIEQGRELYGQLRDCLPGWLIPHYIIDTPTGSGKNLAYNSESISHSGKILDRFNQEHFFEVN